MDGFLGVEQAGRRLGCHPDTIKRLIASGRLPAVKVLGRWRVDPADLECVVDRPEHAKCEDREQVRQAIRKRAANRNRD